MTTTRIYLGLFLFSLVLFTGAVALAESDSLPKTRLLARELAVLVNDNDPLSRQIAEYYVRARRIPPANVLHLRLPKNRPNLTVPEFLAIKKSVDQRTPKHIQAYVLTWMLPYRVECMSITSAFAFGFDRAFCASGCQTTRLNPYFNRASFYPYRDLGLRPTMMLAAQNFAQAKALIDRGVHADRTRPKGTAYLVSTSDRFRNVRAGLYAATQKAVAGALHVDLVTTDALEGRKDVLFYFTGRKTVGKITTNQFLPGALADHLTSAGGELEGRVQTSILRWLEAGATGSYGTVTEPCNYPAKFPHPGVAIPSYLSGSTLIEAYWRSVLMPGQGLFIGEPLACPYER